MMAYKTFRWRIHANTHADTHRDHADAHRDPAKSVLTIAVGSKRCP